MNDTSYSIIGATILVFFELLNELRASVEISGNVFMEIKLTKPNGDIIYRQANSWSEGVNVLQKFKDSYKT